MLNKYVVKSVEKGSMYMKNYQKKFLALVSAGALLTGSLSATELKDDHGYTQRVQAREAAKAATPWNKHAKEALYWTSMGVSLGGQLMAPVVMSLQPKSLWPYALIATPSLVYGQTDNIISGTCFTAGFLSSLTLRALDSRYAYEALSSYSGKAIYDACSLQNAYDHYSHHRSINNHRLAKVFFTGFAIGSNAMSPVILGVSFMLNMPPRQ